MNIDIAIIPETKKKQKGAAEFEDYILLYSGVPVKKKRAAVGIAILVKKQMKNRIQNYEMIDERILKLRYKTHRGYTTLIGVYSPEEGRREEALKFYEKLQKIINGINSHDSIILAGDFNARVGEVPIENVMGKNGERILNSNGQLLIDFAIFNKLRIITNRLLFSTQRHS